MSCDRKNGRRDGANGLNGDSQTGARELRGTPEAGPGRGLPRGFPAGSGLARQPPMVCHASPRLLICDFETSAEWAASGRRTVAPTGLGRRSRPLYLVREAGLSDSPSRSNGRVRGGPDLLRQSFHAEVVNVLAILLRFQPRRPQVLQ